MATEYKYKNIGPMINWNDLFQKKEFWQEYYNTKIIGGYLFKYFGIDEDEYDDSGEIITLALELPFPGEFRLVIELSLDCAYEAAIELQFPLKAGSREMDKQELGWDDGHCFHPSAFRWEELQAIVKCLEKSTQLNFDPVFVPLLLLKFTPATRDNFKTPFEETETFVRRTKLFDEAEIAAVTKDINRIMNDLKWVYDLDRGWVANGDDSYSLRYYGPDFDPDKPFVGNDLEFFSNIRHFMSAVCSEIGADQHI